MRIGIVVDSACDLPQDFIQQNDIVVLPITVRIGDAVLADHRDEEATLSFLHAHVPSAATRRRQRRSASTRSATCSWTGW